ncbi:MAG: OadG family protein [Clostridiales Family XIII bacterium]|jgi:hypothetical protein|nr:OadG family protein [Clostridiales Family XIII bacterium]
MSDELVAVLTAAVAAADSSQLVAVLTAAVHAYRDSEAGSELTIRKIDRRAGVRPAWAVAGNRESIETRRF